MASRDLTRKFVDRRRERRGGRKREHQPYREGSFASDISDVELGASKDEDAPTLPPVWVDLVEAVDRDVERIGRATRELQALHKKRLMVTFDDHSEASLDVEIESKTREATKLFRSCEQTLKRITTANIEDDASDSERTIRGNIQRSSAQKIQRLNQEFRKSQQEYMARLKRQKEGANDATFDFLSGGAEGSEKADDVGFNDQQLQAVADLETTVSERDEEIRKIAESIQELSTIFKELAVLVIDQGTILDRIDFNMEQVAEHTRKGVVEIEKAEQYQKQARPRICILLLLILNALMILFLVLKHQNSEKDKDKKKK
eukprot:CAMPEP_0118901722 /NCGR_PEP_ID=MMETSP1166-20130328/7309_1 /TAXON_ID=1104430 /ORGANISM="Chrysoreinhardia sp, Strain CCMP3193" /LENGTH=316 /DNA_ID=CAMNT_0006840907 /DNA_START=51 /DNA_END=1001 /DNA_ORIENTATION=+